MIKHKPLLIKKKKHKIGLCGAMMFLTSTGSICAECGKEINKRVKKKK